MDLKVLSTVQSRFRMIVKTFRWKSAQCLKNINPVYQNYISYPFEWYHILAVYSSGSPFLQVLLLVYRYSVEHSSNIIGEAKILFSFHHETRVPERVSDGTNTWNCSVAHWPEFQHHFPCDLVPQCREGQDEAKCPYASPECNDGYLHVNGSCYQVTQSLWSVCPVPLPPLSPVPSRPAKSEHSHAPVSDHARSHSSTLPSLLPLLPPGSCNTHSCLNRFSLLLFSATSS